MHVQTFVVIIALTYVFGEDRQIVAKLNPGCERCDPTRRPLIYIRAEGPTDTVHQLWDFTDHVPAVIYAIGTPKSTLTILWTNVNPDKFQFSSPPWYSFAAAIDSIIEYDDLKDIGAYDSQSVNKIWPLDHLSWQLTGSVFTDEEAMVELRGEERARGGLLEMKLDLLPFKGSATDLPHLIHTANSTLIDVRLVNQTEYRMFNSSRFALHFVLVSTDKTSESWSIAMRKSLDDEHTPTVFEIVEIKSARTIQSGDGGFMQFRPVAFTEPQRDVSSSTNAHILSGFNRTALPRRSILTAFYGSSDPEDLVVQDTVISFGLAGDGFYKKHNFTSWSFTIGYGTPPLEGVSTFVLVIISTIVGVTGLLGLFGAGYVLHRRYKHGNSSSRFTNDEDGN